MGGSASAGQPYAYSNPAFQTDGASGGSGKGSDRETLAMM
jgi:hypothetical protein